MNFEEIELLVLDEELSFYIRSRLYDKESPRPEEIPVYDVLEIDEEFLVYKNELKAIHQLFLDKESMKARLDALPDLRLCMESAGFHIPNSAIFYNEIITNLDESRMASLELVAMDISEKLQETIDADLLESKGLKSEVICKRIYRMIIGYNEVLLPEQFPLAIAQYGLAQSHLRNYWPSEAKKEIETIIVDDVYPIEFKAKIVKIFVDNGY